MFAPREPEKRSPRAIAVSVVLHIVLGVVVLRAVVGSDVVATWLIGAQAAPKKEKVEYVSVRPPRGQVASGGTAINATAPPAPARTDAQIVAPTVIPTAIPPAPSGRGGSGGGSGTGVGSGSGAGITRGVTPDYDPRLYPGEAEKVILPRTAKERIDSVIRTRIAQYADSVENNPKSGVTEDGRGDLTITRGGKKYGWSDRGIVLGNFTLPAPLLALLPLNRSLGGNQSVLLKGDNPWQVRSQIQAGAQVALNAETFNERVKRIRERRDRERKESREPPQTPPVPAIQPER
jgi:hypothetical protein